MAGVISGEVIFYYFLNLEFPGLNRRAERLLNLVQQSASTQQRTWVTTRQALALVRCFIAEQGILLSIEGMIAHLAELGIEINDATEAYSRVTGDVWREGDAHYAAMNNAAILTLLSGEFNRNVAQIFEQEYGILLDVLSLVDLEHALALERTDAENAQSDVENVSENTKRSSNDSTEVKPESNDEESENSAAIAQFELSQPGSDPISNSNSLLPWLVASLLFLLSLIKKDSDSSLNSLEQLQQGMTLLPPIPLFPTEFGSGSAEDNPNDDPPTAVVSRPGRNPKQPDHSGGTLASEPGEKQTSPDNDAHSTVPVDQSFDSISNGSSRADFIEVFDGSSPFVRLEDEPTLSNAGASNADELVEFDSNQSDQLPKASRDASVFGPGNQDADTPVIEQPEEEPEPDPIGGEAPNSPVGPVFPNDSLDSDGPQPPDEPLPLPLPWNDKPIQPDHPVPPVNPTQPGDDPASEPGGAGDTSNPPVQPELPGDSSDSEVPGEPPDSNNPISGGEAPGEPTKPLLPGGSTDSDEPDDGATQPNVIDASGGGQVIEILPGVGQVIVANFGGVGKGTHPPQSVVDEVDTLQFIGAAFVPQNLLLTQVGEDLIIQFEGVAQTEVVLRNFQLENLDNFLRPDASVDLSNILFNNQVHHQDSFDVFNADWQLSQVFNPGTTTFLNDLDNRVTGFDQANDVINGQAGHDTLLGLGGDDILRGGFGNDTLIGGAGHNTLIGNEGADTFVISLDGVVQINDFRPGQDWIELPNCIRVDQLQIQPGIGVHSSDTWILSADRVVAILKGVQANRLTTDCFLHPPLDG